MKTKKLFILGIIGSLSLNFQAFAANENGPSESQIRETMQKLIEAPAEAYCRITDDGTWMRFVVAGKRMDIVYADPENLILGVTPPPQPTKIQKFFGATEQVSQINEFRKRVYDLQSVYHCNGHPTDEIGLMANVYSGVFSSWEYNPTNYHPVCWIQLNFNGSKMVLRKLNGGPIFINGHQFNPSGCDQYPTKAFHCAKMQCKEVDASGAIINGGSTINLLSDSSLIFLEPGGEFPNVKFDKY
jgi:hypothetical protein